MQAVRVSQYGSPDVLHVTTVPIPTPETGEALVEMRAAGVGPWDALVRTGKSGVPQRLPLTPGSDVAGVIRSVHASSPAYKVGDEIYGVTNPSFTGGYAQYALVAVDMIAPKPRSLSFVEAASVPVVAVTAWQMLFDQARLRSGQTVLILGAAGNVGSYAVQLAKWAGAHVFAVAASADERYLETLGADRFIDYKKERVGELHRDVDIVIDTVGGQAQEDALSILGPGAILVSSVSQPPERRARERGVTGIFFIVSVSTDRLARIATLIDSGVLGVSVGTVLRLDQAELAHEMLAGDVSHPRGKIVLDLGRSE